MVAWAYGSHLPSSNADARLAVRLPSLEYTLLDRLQTTPVRYVSR